MLVARATSSTAFDTLIGMLELLDEGGLRQLLRLAEDYFAHKHEVALLLTVPASRVLETLVEHVGEVNALTEHVAGGRRLRRGDL